MEVEEKKIKTGKPYEELTKEEKALICCFTEEDNAGMKHEIRETPESWSPYKWTRWNATTT